MHAKTHSSITREFISETFGTDTGLLVCSQKAKIQNKHKTQVKYSAKKVWQQGRVVNSSGFSRLKNAATVQNIKT